MSERLKGILVLALYGGLIILVVVVGPGKAGAPLLVFLVLATVLLIAVAVQWLREQHWGKR